MADVTYSDTITLGELMFSVLKMTDALSVETKKTLVMSASIAGDATAMAKAIASDKYTEILFHALVGRVAKRWRFESFRGPRGGNPAGIVDTIAIRKDTRKSKGDRFEVILVQLKGGSAKMPNADERKRLRETGKRYDAKVVLF